ncbi:MAG TPA: DUF4097 family beta strand repeat-containing protein [Solirubrobacteraceae bacterium]|nr:DUF4097 family beta strand repeat-containing protein [Solirubrobacteraceae bacterium]
MDVPGISRPVLAALIVVAALIFAAAATFALSLVTRHTETRTRTLPAASSIVVDGNSGDVVVVGSDRGDVRLTTKERRSVFGRPRVAVSASGGRLHLDGECARLDAWGACNVSYRLEVPRDTDVRLVARSGDVRANDLRGAAQLQTRSGDVDVDALSPEIDAETRSGDIHVTARDATRVHARTRSGDVHVSVPDRVYAVEAHAQSGDENVGVRTDPRAPRRIDASTVSGDVHIDRDE